ncbi:Microtubule cross-linking factor 1 [Dissostichus eleginoides]|uniref:Microtubule cross-linking factor 1 n=1 Tax=Dissostichus eleginoides TaxID=100907 RepID=A0AAD9F7X8_DISEL|nr:Microtubule cross-linking factor 1 [Dissostichus eleginoides]
MPVYITAGPRHPPTAPIQGCQTDRTQTVSVGTQRVETLSVGTQTVECKVSAVSVATQLSWGTLKSAHVRSKGIQAMVSFKSVGTKTSTYPEFPLASTPIKGPGLGPSKRPRLELEEEQGETSTEFEEILDSSYHPDDTVEESDVSQWESQPIIGSTPVGNLQLSAATYFSGASFFQLQKICRAMQLEIFQYETFRRHARNYLEPAIIHKWKTDQLHFFPATTTPGGKGHSWRRYESRLSRALSLVRELHTHAPGKQNHCGLPACSAAMHHNENADREQATTAAGQHVFKVAYPKSKRGECTAKPEKNDPTYSKL